MRSQEQTELLSRVAEGYQWAGSGGHDDGPCFLFRYMGAVSRFDLADRCLESNLPRGRSPLGAEVGMPLS